MSHAFLEEARPAIERAFNDVPPERREECLETVRQMVAMQAETEESLERSRILAEQLRDSQAALFGKLGELKKTAVQARDTVASVALNVYSNQAKLRGEPGGVN